MYVRPNVALELDVSRSTKYTPVHARLVGAFATGTRTQMLLGGGYVRNSYGGALGQSDGGFSALLGVRYRLTERVWLRAGLDADAMFSTDNSRTKIGRRRHVLDRQQPHESIPLLQRELGSPARRHAAAQGRGRRAAVSRVGFFISYLPNAPEVSS